MRFDDPDLPTEQGFCTVSTLELTGDRREGPERSEGPPLGVRVERPVMRVPGRIHGRKDTGAAAEGEASAKAQGGAPGRTCLRRQMNWCDVEPSAFGSLPAGRDANDCGHDALTLARRRFTASYPARHLLGAP